MARYAKRPGSDTWHFCGNCTEYPRGAGVVTQDTKPTTGELCNQCKSKKANNNCT
jgi:hypothetical protein